MQKIVRKLMLSPPVTLGGMVLLGMMEFVALRRSQAQAQGDDQDLDQVPPQG